MARKPRIQYPGSIYHVMNRGARREQIFIDDKDREMLLAGLDEGWLKTSRQVQASCFKADRFHLNATGRRPIMRAFQVASGLLLLFVALTANAAPVQIISQRAANQPPAAGGNGNSWGPILTPNGRYVVFASSANNLALTTGGLPMPGVLHPRVNVYRRDRVAHLTTLVSFNLSGTGGGNGDSVPSGISPDGRYVLFESAASDLVAGDTNGLTDIFLHDVTSNLNYLVSASTNGGAANGPSRSAAMTPNGRYVAFVSAASNLATNDINRMPDVFVRDLAAGTTVRASIGVSTTNAVTVGPESPQISDDGRSVAFAFYSATTDPSLLPGMNNSGEIYLRDLAAQQTIWVSTAGSSILGTSNSIAFNHQMSVDGRFVAYQVSTNRPRFTASEHGVALRYDRHTGLSDIIHTNTRLQNANWQDIRSLAISPDGRFVAYVARTNDTTTTCVCLWDSQSGVNTLVSSGLDGTIQPGARCDYPAVDSTGRFVAFLSTATNLVSNTLGTAYHLFLRDLQNGATTLVDAGAEGIGPPLGISTAPCLSADGQVTAFECPDSNLVPNDRNKVLDVFVRDAAATNAELVSARLPSLPGVSGNGPSALGAFPSSADGRWIAFTSDADNLVANDTNGYRDVFVHDLFYGSTLLASAGTNGTGANGAASEPALSADGRFLAFVSAADNLVANDTNRAQDVFLRDLLGGSTLLVSRNTALTGPGNAASFGPSVSGDGRYVLFQSLAGNLTAPSLSPAINRLFLRDMQAGITSLLTPGRVLLSSMTPDGRLVAFSDSRQPAAGAIYLWDSVAASPIETNVVPAVTNAIALASDASRLACFGGSPQQGVYLFDRLARTNGLITPRYGAGSRCGLRFSADGRFLTYAAATAPNGTNQVYLYDFQSQTESVLSVAAGSNLAANGHSDLPDISADGRFVLYRSYATNLVPSLGLDRVPALFLFDRITSQTALVSSDYVTGARPDNGSLQARFSPDGRTLLFHSWASTLMAQDLNGSGDLFALALLYVSIASPLTPAQAPILTWSARPGETYAVQFKDRLNDSAWRDLNSPVTILGNRAQVIDPFPTNDQRFYRISAH